MIGGRILSLEGVSANEFCLEITGDGFRVFEGCNVVYLATIFDFLWIFHGFEDGEKEKPISS